MTIHLSIYREKWEARFSGPGSYAVQEKLGSHIQTTTFSSATPVGKVAASFAESYPAATIEMPRPTWVQPQAKPASIAAHA
jgi:hypothetical protein